jgi:hypothetical protein
MSGNEQSSRLLIGAMPPAEKARLIRTLASEATPAQPDTNRIMRPVETARVLGRSVRAVHLLAAQGHLHKITLPGRLRAGGFLASDVYSLIGR